MILNFVIDASSLINIDNTKGLQIVCKLQCCKFWVSPIVIGECQPSCAAIIIDLQEKGVIHFVQDDQVPTGLFLELLSEHQLGAGETEAITAAHALGFGFCCDDRQARILGKNILGDDHVIGSLRVLKWCVEEDWINCARAFELFNTMKESGGFLPATPNTYFCENLPNC